MFKFLRWLVVGPLGVYCVEDSNRMNFFELLLRFATGAVKNRPKGPTTKELEGLVKFGKPVKRYRCKVCRVYFWSWKRRQVCHKWQCYKEVGHEEARAGHI